LPWAQDNESALDADVERIRESLNPPEVEAEPQLPALRDAIVKASNARGLTKDLAALMSQLRAVAGLPIRVDYGTCRPKLPLEETARLLDHCRYTIRFIENVPRDQQNPDGQVLVMHYMDMRLVLKLQVEAAAGQLESLKWDEPEANPQILRHIGELGTLSAAIGPGCCHKCGEMLAQSLLAGYKRDAEDEPLNALKGTRQRFRYHQDAQDTFRERYEDVILQSWMVPIKIASNFCKYTSRSLRDVLKIHFYEPPAHEPALNVNPLTSAMEHVPIALEQVGTLTTGTLAYVVPALRTDSDDEDEWLTTNHVSKEKAQKVVVMIAALRALLLWEEEAAKGFGDEGSQLLGAASKAFQHYLPNYMAYEAAGIAALVHTGMDVPHCFDQVEGQIMTVSTDLFHGMRDAMRRCHQIHQPQLIVQIYNEIIQEALQRYGCMLIDCLSQAQREGIRTTCHVASTADYCLSMTSQLHEAIQDDVPPNQTLGPLFVEAQHQAAQAVTALAMERVKPILQEMKAVTAQIRDYRASFTRSASGVHSVYVTNLSQEIVGTKGLDDTFKRYLSSEAYTIVVVMFVEATIKMFHDEVLALREVNEAVVDQLLNDCSSIQVTLMKLSSTESAVEGIILKEMTTLIGMLETMQRPVEDMVHTFLHLVGPSRNEFALLLATLSRIDRKLRRALLKQFDEALSSGSAVLHRSAERSRQHSSEFTSGHIGAPNQQQEEKTWWTRSVNFFSRA